MLGTHNNNHQHIGGFTLVGDYLSRYIAYQLRRPNQQSQEHPRNNTHYIRLLMKSPIMASTVMISHTPVGEISSANPHNKNQTAKSCKILQWFLAQVVINGSFNMAPWWSKRNLWPSVAEPSHSGMPPESNKGSLVVAKGIPWWREHPLWRHHGTSLWDTSHAWCWLQAVNTLISCQKRTVWSCEQFPGVWTCYICHLNSPIAPSKLSNHSQNTSKTGSTWNNR